MDTIIDNVLLTYVSYGLVLTSEKPEVLRAVSATFSENEVADAKYVLWTQYLDHIGEKPNQKPSSLRSRKMANVPTGRQIRGVRMTRGTSVFVYRLDDSVTMDMMNKHLVSNGIQR